MGFGRVCVRRTHREGLPTCAQAAPPFNSFGRSAQIFHLTVAHSCDDGFLNSLRFSRVG